MCCLRFPCVLQVKTLRCAIDYISHLQRLLLLDNDLATDDYVTQRHVTSTSSSSSSTLRPPRDDVTAPSAYQRSANWTRP